MPHLIICEQHKKINSKTISRYVIDEAVKQKHVISILWDVSHVKANLTEKASITDDVFHHRFHKLQTHVLLFFYCFKK